MAPRARRSPRRAHPGPDRARATATDELEKRERALLEQHQKTWIAPIRPWIRSWEWRRGFVEHVVADGAKFLEGASTVLATTPLSRLVLTGLKPPVLEALAATPSLGTVRWLDLSQQRIDPKTAHVFRAPNLSAVDRLELWGNPLGDAGIVTLASAQHLGALRALNVSQCGLTVDGLEALSNAEFFPRLEALDISWPGGDGALGPRAGTLLTRARSLVTLKLYHCQIGDEGLEALAGSPELQNLEELELVGNPITARGALALARSPDLPRLRRVLGLTPAPDGEVRPEPERRFDLRW